MAEAVTVMDHLLARMQDHQVKVKEIRQLRALHMGGPTQRHRLSPALRAFLDRLLRRSLPGLSAAAFDTRYHMAAWKSGSAAHEIARRFNTSSCNLQKAIRLPVMVSEPNNTSNPNAAIVP
jgi:flavorubredoxin